MTNKQSAIKALFESMTFPRVSATRSTSSTKSTYTGYPLMFKNDNGLGQADFNSKMSNDVISSYGL